MQNAPETILFWKKGAKFQTKAQKYSKLKVNFMREIGAVSGRVGIIICFSVDYILKKFRRKLMLVTLGS